MTMTMDTAAMRSAKRQKIDAKAARERMDSALLNFAKAIGHHGAKNLIEAIRQRDNIAITDDYASDLLARAGFVNL